MHNHGTEEGAGAAGAGAIVAPAAVAPQVPFWQQKWFKLANVVLLPLGLGFLFIVLFPVVTAIVQMVVNRSSLGIDVAAISQPQNSSYVLFTPVVPACADDLILGSNWR